MTANINPAFCKIAQLKQSDYTALIDPVHDIGDGRHGSTWRADIPLLMRRLDELALRPLHPQPL